jgi:GT2 family glycosyltransferase
MENRTAIILVNWNSFILTAGCIDSLRQMHATAYDIIVVDNGSHDGSGQQLKDRFPDIVLIESATNRGFTGGNNLGMEYALQNGYTFVFLLNNDTFVRPDLLDVLWQFMDQHPEAGAVQPLIYMNHDRSLLWNGGSFYNKWLGQSFTPGYNRPPRPVHFRTREVDWITGCALFVRGTALRQAGLFAENLFIYSEDVDLSFRIRKQGWKLFYHPQTALYHIAGMANRTTARGREGYVSPSVHYLSIRNRIWLLKAHTAPIHILTAGLFNFFYILMLMAYFAARLYPGKLKTVLKAVKDGINGNIIYN